MPGKKAIQIDDIVLTYQGPLMYEAKVCFNLLLVYLFSIHVYTHVCVY